MFRQFLLLAWCAGIFASRYFLPGAAAWALIALLCLWRLASPPPAPIVPQPPTASRLASLFALFTLLASFCVGSLYANWRSPEAEPLPGWAREAITPGENGSLYRSGLRLRGTVDAVEGQTDRRLRIILSAVEPLDEDGAGNAPPLPGRLVLTWYDPLTPEAVRVSAVASHETLTNDAAGIVVNQSLAVRGAPAFEASGRLSARPIPGERLEATLKLRPVRSLMNPGLWELEDYWADRGVWQRAWSRGGQTGLRLLQADSRSAPGIADRLAAWREELRIRVLTALPGVSVASPGDNPMVTRYIDSGADFIPALLFGDKFLMDSADADLLAKSTLSHSLALSGLHLGYAAAVGYACAYLLFWRFPGLAARIPKRQAALALALLPAALYTWLGGTPPSLLRAGLMLFFWGLLLLLRRPAVLQDGLLWAVGIILLFDPLTLFDLRLQLSALAIAAIALAAPLLSSLGALASGRILRGDMSRLKVFAARLVKAVIFMLGISLAAQLVMMPVLVRAFGIYGLAFPLNLLWLPVLGLLVMPAAFCGLAACALNLSGLAELCFQVAAFPCARLMELLRWLEQGGLLPTSLPTRPHWLFFLGYWLLLALIPVCISRWVARKKQPKATRSETAARWRAPAGMAIIGLALCLWPLVLRHYETSRDIVRLRLLDVGQGQAVLLEWQGGGRLLLDGGGGISPRFDIGKAIIAATLLDNRPPRLDYMLASHPDLDHMQGLLFPLCYLEVGYFADNGAADDDTGAAGSTLKRLEEILAEKNMPRHSLHAGQELRLGPDLRLEVLHPPAPLAATDGNPKFVGNNASLVLRLVWKGRPLALLCGDAEKPAQRHLLQQLGQGAAEGLAAQVLILPHHGSAGASLAEFYQAVGPELALVSCGYGNQWNFPSATARQNLSDLKIPLLDTAEKGQILIEWAADGEMKVGSARRP